MRDIFELLKKKDVGAIGIGAMIVFIALILVAGVAASVLIQTSNTVQLQAMKTGQDTMKEVAGGVAVYDIEGMVNKTAGTIYNMKYLAITVRPRPGSGDVDLNNTYILMSDGLKKVLLRYGYANSSLFITKASAAGDIFGLLSAINWKIVNYERFGIAVMQDYDGSMTRFSPVMNRGDKAVLFVRCSGLYLGAFGRELPERTDVFGQVVPERGSPGVIAFATPMSYADIIYDVQ